MEVEFNCKIKGEVNPEFAKELKKLRERKEKFDHLILQVTTILNSYSDTFNSESDDVELWRKAVMTVKQNKDIQELEKELGVTSIINRRNKYFELEFKEVE